MAETQNICFESANSLDAQLAQLTAAKGDENDQLWSNVQASAQALANGLRIRDGAVDNQTALGKTLLPQTITSLFKAALAGSPIPDDARTGVVSEILRVAANLCMDHDENRSQLLEAGLPQAIVSLLEGYAESVPGGLHEDPLPLPIPHIKVVKHAIGVLLNSSVAFAPIKTRLTSLEAAVTILKLSISIYPPGSWLSATLPETSESDILESWTLRCGLSNWSWRAISELKDDSNQMFNAAIVPLLIPALRAFTPPYPKLSSTSSFAQPSPLRTTLLQADFDSLEESCMFLESLSLDVEDFRLSLARGLHFPAEHDGVLCLSSMLSFVEKGDYPPLWYETGSDPKNNEKAFDICKAAMIKAIVEVSGEEKNADVLWDDCEPGRPGGDFVCRMVDWIRKYVAENSGVAHPQPQNGVVERQGRHVLRDDMAICATLSLGNLARREKHSSTLLLPPHSVGTLLSSPWLLGPTADIRLKHGVVGLLKCLAQSSLHSPESIAVLTKAGIVSRLASSRIWDGNVDPMAEVVQVGAIGVVKNLCTASVENTFALVLPSTAGDQTSLQQILALGLRSDSVRIKSEGTRVLVNVIKSLWGSEPPSTPAATTPINSTLEERQRKKAEAKREVIVPACAEALARLIGRSGKYPILVNEGVVALSLLSMQKQGAPLVADAIVAPLPLEVGPAGAPPLSVITAASASTSTGTDPLSPVSRSSRRASSAPPALNMLVSVLKNVVSQITSGSSPAGTVDFPLEIGVNVCTLVCQLGKNADAGQAMTTVKDAAKPVLEEIFIKAGKAQGKEGMVGAAAKKALDVLDA